MPGYLSVVDQEGNMKAGEARVIAGEALRKKKIDISLYLNAIERAAKKGLREVTFNVLNLQLEKELIKLGYKIDRVQDTDVVKIRW